MVKDLSETTRTGRVDHPFFGKKVPLPGLLVVHAPPGACAVDRCPITSPFVVGRSASADLPVTDERISKAHFRISRQQGELVIEDNESTNGTFVQGRPLLTKTALNELTIIRAGQSLFLFVPDITKMIRPKSSERYGMAGTFHTDVLVSELEDAAHSVRHILLTGPSGTGKELASKAVYAIMQEKGGLQGAFVAHNAARFANEEEASTTLFGVGGKVFSNVEAREGLIEVAHNGVLFLDEVHNLPERVQRTLLRIMEDGQTSRIGETKMRPAKVRFVLASNVAGPTCGLAHDLFARVRVVRIAPLKDRVGDIPDIFLKVIKTIADKYQVDGTMVARHLGADHFEALCLDGLPFDNVRGLVDLADRIMTRIANGEHAGNVIQDVFSERFSDSPVADRGGPSEDIEGAAHYINNKEYIIAAYRECHANMSAVERVLKTRGFQCSRRWLTHYLERWGVKPK